MNKEHAGSYGWAGIGLGVITFDLLAPESLSHAFQRGMDSKYRPVMLGALAITAAHLLDIIPDQYDPFHLTIDRIKHVTK